MDRIVLKTIGQIQLPAVAKILQNKTIIKTYMVPDLTDEDALSLARRLADLSLDKNRYVRGIYRGEHLIGFINDTGIEKYTIELGWVIHPEFHNRGFATAAVRLAIRELFDIGFQKIIAGAFEQNIPSRRVMEKCGMVRLEQTDEIEYRGQCHHCVYYGITSCERIDAL